MKQIWMYTTSLEKKKQIHHICEQLGLTVGVMEASDLNKVLSQVIGMPRVVMSNMTPMGQNQQPMAPALYCMQELLLFVGMTSEQMDTFLEAYKKAGIEPVSLKAVLTPTNMHWTIYQLLEELKKEHSSLHP